MDYKIHRIDPVPNLNAGIQPVYFIERELLHGDKAKGDTFSQAQVARVGTYWTPKHSLLGPPQNWSVTRDGQYVAVPVLAYRSEYFGLPAILQNGLILGAAAMDQYRQITNEVPLILHIVYGSECTPLPTENSYRCYVGFSVQSR